MDSRYTLAKLALLGTLGALSGCAHSDNISCIRGEGTTVNGTHVVDAVQLSSDGRAPLGFEATINCRGEYWLSLGFTPADDVLTTIRDGKKAYVRQNSGDPATHPPDFLSEHTISYRVIVRSLSVPERAFSVDGTQSIPPYQFGFSAVTIAVPRQFGVSEPVRIEVEIMADDAFYRDYTSIGGTIRRAHQ